MKQSKWSTRLSVLGLIALASFYLLSEVRWSRVNNPAGKFSNVQEYLDHGRLPSRVMKVEKNGNTFFIALSPLDTWLAIPSGSAAYVFDESGQLVDWSSDLGDDPGFQQDWWRPPLTESSIDDLEQI